MICVNGICAWSVSSVHRNGVCTISRICTFLSVDLHDPQVLYDLRDFSMVWRICKNLDTSHLFASFSTGMGLYEADISQVCTCVGSV